MNPILTKDSTVAKWCADVSYINEILKPVHSIQNTRLTLKIRWSNYSDVLKSCRFSTPVLRSPFAVHQIFMETKTSWPLNLEEKVMETCAAASSPHQSSAFSLFVLCGESVVQPSRPEETNQSLTGGQISGEGCRRQLRCLNLLTAQNKCLLREFELIIAAFKLICASSQRFFSVLFPSVLLWCV